MRVNRANHEAPPCDAASLRVLCSALLVAATLLAVAGAAMVAVACSSGSSAGENGDSRPRIRCHWRAPLGG